ncbi:MAG: hypothetical protein H6577_04390 [Lewinellaceae bacterium]|nr:hypothetical protein [Lewinellaceae bacterium]
MGYLCFDSPDRSSSMPIRGTHNALLHIAAQSQPANPTQGSYASSAPVMGN